MTNDNDDGLVLVANALANSEDEDEFFDTLVGHESERDMARDVLDPDASWRRFIDAVLSGDTTAMRLALLNVPADRTDDAIRLARHWGYELTGPIPPEPSHSRPQASNIYDFQTERLNRRK